MDTERSPLPEVGDRIYLDGCPNTIIEVCAIPSSDIIQGITTYGGRKMKMIYNLSVHKWHKHPAEIVGIRSILELVEKPCTHNWLQYVGFTERYLYCKNCDQKEAWVGG